MTRVRQEHATIFIFPTTVEFRMLPCAETITSIEEASQQTHFVANERLIGQQTWTMRTRTSNIVALEVYDISFDAKWNCASTVRARGLAFDAG